MRSGQMDRRVTFERPVLVDTPPYGLQPGGWELFAVARMPAQVLDALPGQNEQTDGAIRTADRPARMDRDHNQGVQRMSSELNLVGGAELDRLLQTLAPKIEKNIMRSALVAGARVIMREAKALAPVGRPSNVAERDYGGYPGALRDSVRVTSGFNKRGFAYASVKAGGRTKKGADVFYAHIVEFGARRHQIRARAKKVLEIGGKFAGGQVEHPGVRPRPFMRPAADLKAREAVEVVQAKVRQRLQKFGVDVPTPVVEDE